MSERSAARRRGHRPDRGLRGEPAKTAAPPPGASRRLAQAQMVWLATVRPAGAPHLAPVWFVWLAGCLHICTSPASVKARNLAANPRAAVALENGTRPLIAEGEGTRLPRPWPPDVVAAFRQKYDWSIDDDNDYTCLLRFRPARWLAW